MGRNSAVLALALLGAACNGKMESDTRSGAQPAAQPTQPPATTYGVTIEARASATEVEIKALFPAGGATSWTDAANLPGFSLTVPSGALGAETLITAKLDTSDAQAPKLTLAADPPTPPNAPLTVVLPQAFAAVLSAGGTLSLSGAEIAAQAQGSGFVATVTAWGLLEARPKPAAKKAPTAVAAALAFTDTDDAADQCGGDVVLTRPADDAGVSAYELFWGSSADAKVGDQPLATLSVAEGSGATLTLALPQGTARPSGATHLIAYATGEGGRAATGKAAVFVDLVPHKAGFASRTSFRLKAALAAGATCQTQAGAAAVTARSDGWLQVDGLAPGTVHDVACSDGAHAVRFQLRTFGATREVAVAGAQFTQGGVTYTLGGCMNDGRILRTNPVTGSFDAFGQSAGDGTKPPSSCFATYDGLAWHVTRLDYPGEVPGNVIDYNAGIGLAHLPDGTTVARDTVKVGANWYNRLNFCAGDCGVKASWTALIMDGALGGQNPCQAGIAVSRDNTKLVLANTCGTADYTECSLATDCKLLANWSAPARVQSGIGSGTHVLPFHDSTGGVWIMSSSIAEGILHCPGTADCKVAGNWRKGKLNGQTWQISEAYLEQEGSKLRLVAAKDYTLGAPFDWVAAECDVTAGDCGQVDGSGDFANFTVTRFAMSKGRLQRFWRTATGYGFGALDNNDADYVKVSHCTGNFAACFANGTGWSALALPSDGANHAWGFYMERGGGYDGRGDAISWMSGEEALVFLDPL